MIVYEKNNKLVEKYDDNPGAYFSMLVEGFEDKDESLKEDKFVPQDKMSKKAQKELNDKKRGTWGNTNPVTRVQPNKKAYDRKRDKKITDENLEESVLNESSDGWDEDKLEELIELLDRLYDLRYEVTSTIRGAYTNCKTYEELGRYVSELAEGLDSVGTDITLIDEDEEDEEEDLSSYGMESGYYN